MSQKQIPIVTDEIVVHVDNLSQNYTVIGLGKGAGSSLRHIEAVVYRNEETGEIWLRDPKEWDRMQYPPGRHHYRYCPEYPVFTREQISATLDEACHHAYGRPCLYIEDSPKGPFWGFAESYFNDMVLNNGIISLRPLGRPHRGHLVTVAGVNVGVMDHICTSHGIPAKHYLVEAFDTREQDLAFHAALDWLRELTKVDKVYPFHTPGHNSVIFPVALEDDHPFRDTQLLILSAWTTEQ